MRVNNLFLNIGAMKAGTTWLYAMLEHHPDIHFSLEKEVHFFAHIHTHHKPLRRRVRYERFKSFIGGIDPEALPNAELQPKLRWYSHFLSEPVDDNWYTNLFIGKGSKKYCADFSNLSSHLEKDGWDHVKGLTNNLKVMYIMRDPVARLWSHLKFHMQFTGEIENFKTWTAGQMNDLARKRFIWENAEYSRVVRNVIENLQTDQYRIVFFEDIHEGPLAWLRGVEEFLEISRADYDESRLGSRVNVSKSMEMPEYFLELFGPDINKEILALEELGLNIPPSWDYIREFS